MSSSAPLTSHHLEGEDRARLIRSNRKLGDVFGETPRVVDLAAFPQSLERPTATLTKSKRKLPDPPTAPPAPASDSRPLLYIHVPPSRPADSDPTPSPTTPARSPTLTIAFNLHRPITKARDDATRRRKIAKLSRTLGVPVPTELVFPPEKKERRRSRRFTSRTLPLAVERLGGPALPKQLWLGRIPTDPISRGWVWVGRRHEIPSDVQLRMQRSSGVDKPDSDKPLPNDWVSVGRPLDGPKEVGLQPPRGKEVAPPQHQAISKVQALYRQGKGWSGEWAGSVGNMDQVVKQLRTLRLK
ncbi:hypothetical protein C8R46DRAFT_1210026 [Mycena filopes]|nr:hypothetical protein C8R46DRAFT_1210026 [Mycena filopes]